MAASLLKICQKRVKRGYLPITQLSLLFFSNRPFVSKPISSYQHKSEYYNKQFYRLLTYTAVLTSGLSYLFYNEQDERRRILYTLKSIVFPTVCATELTNVTYNRDKYNFIADVVELSAPSVVYIEIKDQKRIDVFTGKPVTSSNGSGFIVKEDGLILTNAHVVINKPNTVVKVRLQDGTNYTGTVEDIDIQSDLATVRIDKTNLPVMKLGNSSKLRPGEFVVAIGSPLALSNTITSGVVSSVNRNSEELGLHHKHMEYIQTDAAITFGNSGGPLVNLDGEAIGINAMKVTAGISFAIPIDYAKDFLKKADERKRNRGLNVSSGSKEHNRRRYLGITMLTLTPDIINDMGQTHGARYSFITHGVLIWKVIFGSPAYTGGLKPGDIITHVNEDPIQSSNDIYSALEKNHKFFLTVIRNGIILQINVHPEDP